MRKIIRFDICDMHVETIKDLAEEYNVDIIHSSKFKGAKEYEEVRMGRNESYYIVPKGKVSEQDKRYVAHAIAGQHFYKAQIFNVEGDHLTGEEPANYIVYLPTFSPAELESLVFDVMDPSEFAGFTATGACSYVLDYINFHAKCRLVEEVSYRLSPLK